MNDEIDNYYRDKTERTAETVELFLIVTMIVAIAAVIWAIGMKVMG